MVLFIIEVRELKKKVLIIMFVLPLFIFITGCTAQKKTQSIKCSVTMSSGFEQYGEISYYTSTKFDGTNNVTLDIDINFTKITLNATQISSIEKQMKTKFCSGLFSNAPTCESTKGSNVIKFHVNGTMNQVYTKFGQDAFNLENVKSYLETTEHMTCAVESE
jgi:hypothetical protein